MEPLQLYNGAIRYVEASAQIRPDNADAVAEQQVQRLVQEIGTMDCNQAQSY